MLSLNEPVISAKPATVHAVSTYPPNRSGWLHKFSSILARAEVAREIGRDAAFLILAIAIQEDAQQYQSAPIYFDSELQRMTGIRSRQQLDRIRQKAVDAGWLVVAKGAEGDQSVARYWTVIPSRLNVFHEPFDAGVTAEQAGVQSRGVATPPRTKDVGTRLSDNVEATVPAISPVCSVSPALPAAEVAEPEPSVETHTETLPDVSRILNSKMTDTATSERPAGQTAKTELCRPNVVTGIEAGVKSTATSESHRGQRVG